MSEYETSSIKSYDNNNNNNVNQINPYMYPYQEEMSTSNNNDNKGDNTNRNYISSDGTKLNLSGVDLTTEEGINILNDALKNNPNITKLNLKNCNIVTVPKEIFNFKKLSSLDIRNNKFENFEESIKDLSQFTDLIELKIDLDNQNQVLIVLTNLPNLHSLNGKITRRSSSIIDIDLKDIDNISLENNMDEYSEIVNRLNKKDNLFFNKFQKKLTEEEGKIKECLNTNIPNYIYANLTLKSQVELQKNLAEKFLQYLKDENDIIGNFLFKIIFKTSDKLVDLINHLYPKMEEKTINLRNQLEKAMKAAEELSDYEAKYKELLNKNKILEANCELLQKKLKKYEKENKIITQKINKTTRDIMKKNDKLNTFLYFSDKNKMNKSNYQNNIYNNKEVKTTKNNNFYKPFMNTTNNSNNNNALDNNNNNNNINSNQQINYNSLTLNPNRKPLSKKITKDIINELYNSKAYYDRICYENKLASETLEQYMYIFFNNKYGLKNLVIDWASALINAIKLYSNEDCEINLFGKILKNEQEEASRQILTKLKENIAELLEHNFRFMYPYKSQQEIDSMMIQKKNGFLLEEEWKGIIYYLYNNEDSQIIENKIMDYINDQKNKVLFILDNGEEVNNERFITYQNNNTINADKMNLSRKLNNTITDVFLTDKKNITRKDLSNINRLKDETIIPYKDFIQIVCNNQIINREKYMKKFVDLFRRFDKDGDGILNEEQFIEMVKAIPYCQNNLEENVNRFLSIIDPFNKKKITFNNCVALFSSEIIVDESNENNVSLINLSQQGFENIESQNIGLNIQNETTLLDKICLGN